MSESPGAHLNDRRDAALAEIEISPEMIEAGVDSLGHWNVAEDRLDWIVEAVYRAMRLREPVRRDHV